MDSSYSPSGLYLQILKEGSYKPKNGQLRTWPLETKNNAELKDDTEVNAEDEEDADEENYIEILEENSLKITYHKAKLLQFHENHRPAYWGTWNKSHDKIKGRNPFARYHHYNILDVK